MSRLWRQVREVQIGNADFTGFAMNVSVVMPDDDPLEYSLELYNVADDTYDAIDVENDRVTIALGWEETTVETLITGTIDRTWRTLDGNDVVYHFEGIDESEDAVKARVSQRFRNAEPDRIAAELAASVGLSVEADSVDAPILGIWSVTRDRKVKDWLDDLVERTGELTGEAWEWYVEQGTLFFVRKNTTTAEAPLLSYDTNLLEISARSRGSDDASEELEFEAVLDPRVRKGAEVVVDTERYSGVYKVRDYEFQSDSTRGTHIVAADIDATDEARLYEPETGASTDTTPNE